MEPAPELRRERGCQLRLVLPALCLEAYRGGGPRLAGRGGPEDRPREGGGVRDYNTRFPCGVVAESSRCAASARPTERMPSTDLDVSRTHHAGAPAPWRRAVASAAGAVRTVRIRRRAAQARRSSAFRSDLG